MPEPPRRRDPRERQQLMACLQNVDTARSQLRSARQATPHRWDKFALRAELLDALESCAAALTQYGAPVPRRLHNEIELYRRLQARDC